MMAEKPNAMDPFEGALSSWGGTPLDRKASYFPALASRGITDAEQVVSIAAVPSAARLLQESVSLKDQAFQDLIKELKKELPPGRADEIGSQASVRPGLGARRPPAEAKQPPSLSGLAQLPSSINHAQEMPDVKNQGQRGTCVAFGSTALHELNNKISGNPQTFSEQWLYYRCKQIDGWPNACGTTLWAAHQALTADGQCRDSIYGYIPQLPCNNHGTVPPGAAGDAASFRLGTIYLNSTDVNGIKSILAGGSVVPFCVPVYDSWYSSQEVYRSGRITMPLAGENPIGYPTNPAGHCMCLIGYQDDQSGDSPGGGFFILRNSWGGSFGYQCPYGVGNGTIPYQYIASDCSEAVGIDGSGRAISVSRRVTQTQGAARPIIIEAGDIRITIG